MTEDLLILITLAQQGESDAFGKIYNLFLKRVYRFIYFLVNDHEMAQDFTQNTFLKVWKSLPAFSPEKGSFQAFLFTVARNLVIDHWRKKKEVSLEKVGEIESGENPQDLVSSNEEKERIHQALTVLDNFERHLIVLRYFEELSFSEITQVVGGQEGAVRVRVHRILKKLKTTLKER